MGRSDRRVASGVAVVSEARPPRGRTVMTATVVEVAASGIRSDADGDPCPGHRQTRTIAAMARPLRCRLRLHAWEYRENPETHEHYQVCLRCKAYRDKGNSAFDGRGSWGLGG